MFKVGDRVIHPGHGICTVKEVRENPSSPQGSIYVLKPDKTMRGAFKLMIPEEFLEKSGVHYPILPDDIPRVLQVLREQSNDLSEDQKSGYVSIKVKIQRGNVYQLAEVIRDLSRYKDRRFSSTLNSLLKSAQKRLVEEIAFVEGIPKVEVERQIKKIFKPNIKIG